MVSLREAVIGSFSVSPSRIAAVLICLDLLEPRSAAAVGV
jgi:hypothetical protein